jgi:hypothetical protein
MHNHNKKPILSALFTKGCRWRPFFPGRISLVDTADYRKLAEGLGGSLCKLCCIIPFNLLSFACAKESNKEKTAESKGALFISEQSRCDSALEQQNCLEDFRLKLLLRDNG